MKITCPCCDEELTPEDRLMAIQDLMFDLDELLGAVPAEIRDIVHQAIVLSELDDDEQPLLQAGNA